MVQMCVCVSSTGKKCPYRAVYMDTKMCGVHHLFHKNLDILEKNFPKTFQTS